MTAGTPGRAPPSPSAPVSEVWAYIEEIIRRIMATEKGGEYHDSMGLYDAVYNCCTSSRDQMDTAILAGRSDNLPGAELYSNFAPFFAKYLKELVKTTDSLRDQALLQYYSACWDRYITGVDSVNRSSSYINRHWVKRERDEGRRNVHTIRVLAVILWKDIFLAHMRRDLTNAFLHEVERARKGETFDEAIVQKIANSLLSPGLDFDENDVHQPSNDIYDDMISTPFLSATAEHCPASYATSSISDYLKNTEPYVRVSRSLSMRTRVQLDSLLVSPVVWGAFRGLFERDELDDLRRLGALAMRVPEHIREWVEDHIRHSGIAAVAELESTRDTGTITSDLYVETLLEVYDRYHTRCQVHSDLITSLDKACLAFINKNAATGDSCTKSSELLVGHIDGVLRKDKTANRSTQDCEKAIDQVITLFKYLEDKDIFQHMYSVKLARRLVRSLSTSDDAEARMIAKLTDTCGVEYTQSLRRMLTDIALSADISAEFNSRMAEALDMDFSVMILGTSVWPLQAPKHEFIIPKELLSTYERFHNFYVTRHSGRKLVWLWNHSRNELRTTYTDQNYILKMSSYQMAVLVQYNNNDALSAEDLMTATTISKNILTPILAVLVKSKILINEKDNQYALNLNFRSKKIRVNINTPLKVEQEPEGSDLLKRVNEDHKYVIQANIVRLMKTHKTMKNQDLIQEVISQVSQRFTPKIPDIKKAIEALMEKEYIERVEGKHDTFAYVV